MYQKILLFISQGLFWLGLFLLISLSGIVFLSGFIQIPTKIDVTLLQVIPAFFIGSAAAKYLTQNQQFSILIKIKLPFRSFLLVQLFIAIGYLQFATNPSSWTPQDQYLFPTCLPEGRSLTLRQILITHTGSRETIWASITRAGSKH